ncbi:MAG TPA: hypothetical protein VGN37_15645 [Actinocatenispora sp.]
MSGPQLAGIHAECAHEFGMRRTDLVDRLSRRWSEILEKLREQPLITQAAQLTEEEFATVMTRFKETRRSDLTEIHDLLEKAMSDSKGLGIGGFEWAESVDRNLRMLLRELNLRDETATR